MQKFFSHSMRAHKTRGNQQSGYILLMMMLFIAMVAIAGLAAVPKLEMQVKRDREQEMIHRGAQYARAIRAYVKKFGRYPTSIADLENTNNVRFLRRRYKDPLTGKDFRLLYMGDVQTLIGGAGMGGATMGGGAFTGNAGAAAGAGQAGMQQGGVPVGTAGPGGSAQADNAQAGTAGDNSGANNANSGDNSSNGNSSSTGSSSSSGPTGQVFGGGPIMGVASSSKNKTIRVFNNKEHYNEWLFVYDPTNDFTLITGPYQPLMMGQGAGQSIGQPIGPNGIGNQGNFGNSGNTGFGSQPTQQQSPGQQSPGMTNQTPQQ